MIDAQSVFCFLFFCLCLLYTKHHTTTNLLNYEELFCITTWLIIFPDITVNIGKKRPTQWPQHGRQYQKMTYTYNFQNMSLICTILQDNVLYLDYITIQYPKIGQKYPCPVYLRQITY